MNFQPSDYLSNLNLEFDNADISPIDENSHNADLDFFSQADFFDLDVFSNDFAAREKQNMSLQLPPAQAQPPVALKTEAGSNVAVKLEETESTVAGSRAADVGFGGNGEISPAELLGQDLATSGPGSPIRATDSLDTQEVKRRRNTAASARFRVKKKLKEKQMEQHARELQERLSHLEKKLRTMEMENKCLRQLIVEKTEKKNCDLLESIKKRSLGGVSSGGHNTATAFTYTN